MGADRALDRPGDLGRETDDIEDAVSASDVIVELLQRRLAEHDPWVGAALVHALERRALTEQDEASGFLGQEAHVARVGLVLEDRDQSRKVDDRGLQ